MRSVIRAVFVLPFFAQQAPPDYRHELKELRRAIDRSREKDGWDRAGVIASILAFGVVAWTAWLTHKMRESAHAQAVAAQDTLKEAKNQTLLESRPIIVAGNSVLAFSATGSNLGISLRNVGRGAAFYLRLAEMKDGDFTLLIGERVTKSILERDQSTDLRFAINHVSSGEGCNNAGEFLARLRIAHAPIVFIAVEYDDVFRNSWRSTFMISANQDEREFKCEFYKAESCKRTDADASPNSELSE